MKEVPYTHEVEQYRSTWCYCRYYCCYCCCICSDKIVFTHFKGGKILNVSPPPSIPCNIPHTIDVTYCSIVLSTHSKHYHLSAGRSRSPSPTRRYSSGASNTTGFGLSGRRAIPTLFAAVILVVQEACFRSRGRPYPPLLPLLLKCRVKRACLRASYWRRFAFLTHRKELQLSGEIRHIYGRRGSCCLKRRLPSLPFRS